MSNTAMNEWYLVASFTKEVNPRLVKRPLKTNGRLANRGLTSLVKEATANQAAQAVYSMVCLVEASKDFV